VWGKFFLIDLSIKSMLAFSKKVWGGIVKEIFLDVILISSD
jgi:hypothetical protein